VVTGSTRGMLGVVLAVLVVVIVDIKSLLVIGFLDLVSNELKCLMLRIE